MSEHDPAAPSGAESPAGEITASPEAAQALRRLIAENGDLIVHIAGGAEDAGSPVVLPARELSLGPRDLLLGWVEGVPVYRMPSRPSGLEPGRHYVLDVRRAMPVGFSLSPGEGWAFALREVLSPRT